MDPIPGKQQASAQAIALVNGKPIEVTLHDPAPAALARIIAFTGPPQFVGADRWDVALALRVSKLQWSGEEWTMDHYDDWMALWHKQLPMLDFSRGAGETPVVFHLLDDMGHAEQRFLAGRMHLDRWEGFIKTMTGQGLDLSACNRDQASALEYLLQHTTKHPYTDLACRWIEDGGAKFNNIASKTVLDLLDRLIDAKMRTPAFGGELPHATRKTMMAAVNACREPCIGVDMERWREQNMLNASVDDLVAAAMGQTLDITTTPRPDCKHAPHSRRL